MTTTDVDNVTPGAEVNADASSNANDDVTGANTDTDTQGGSDGKSREARYRVERNQARAEVDRLSGVVAAMQQREVDRLCEAADLKPKALAAAGVELADLLGDDGTVDVEKVNDAVGVAREELGLGPRAPKASPTQGQFGRDGGGSDDWAAAFAPSPE
ncbi:hypothetical protein [Gordonia sp. MMO-8]|uniref:hypothetical protein n=1 Tax=Gordonia sp. MMO-8 TaxID=3127886 RepID=UPI0030197B53